MRNLVPCSQLCLPGTGQPAGEQSFSATKASIHFCAKSGRQQDSGEGALRYMKAHTRFLWKRKLVTKTFKILSVSPEKHTDLQLELEKSNLFKQRRFSFQSNLK